MPASPIDAEIHGDIHIMPQTNPTIPACIKPFAAAKTSVRMQATITCTSNPETVSPLNAQVTAPINA